MADPRDDFNHPDHDSICGWCGEDHGPDRERIAAAREFFWAMVEQQGSAVTSEEAKRHIGNLAAALPPFTRVASHLL